MSDTTQTQCPYDSLIAILREQEADLLAQSTKIDASLATVRESIMLVSSRRPKAPRKARPVAERTQLDPDGMTAGEEPSPRPTVFATPSLVADAA